MPRLELTEKELIVHLGLWEAIAACRRSIRVPLAHVRGATDDEGYSWSDMGIRAPGTHLPGVIVAGTFFKKGDKQFVFVGRKTHPVVIELADERWTRMVVGVQDARATAALINSALKKA